LAFVAGTLFHACLRVRLEHHGKGAALFARLKLGAIYGQGEGLQGESYAIPTKGVRSDRTIYTLPLDEIRQGVQRFLAFASSRPDLKFQVTPIGCGLAGYAPAQIAPMFRGSPANCLLPPEFLAARTAPASPNGALHKVAAIRFPHPPRRKTADSDGAEPRPAAENIRSEIGDRP
jgi:hypothetical protein